jgi:hypothetical protein
MKSRLARPLVFVLLLAFYGSRLLHPIRLPAGQDIGRHVKNGEMLLDGRFEVLHENLYSYTEPETPFTNFHWLSGLVFHAVHGLAGFEGLVVFKALVLLAAFALLFSAATKRADFWLVALFSVPAILILRQRTNVRPEIFSYFFIAAFLQLLLDLEKRPDGRRALLLVPCQLLWVNLHILFPIGPLLVGGALLERVVLSRRDMRGDPLVRKLALLLLAVVAVTFVNPSGVEGAVLAFPLNITGDSPIPIAENQSLLDFLRYAPVEDPSVPVFLASVAFLAFSSGFGLRQRPVFLLLASLATAAGGFLVMRAIVFFGFVFLPAVAANLDGAFAPLKDAVRKRTAPGFGSCVLVAVALVYLAFAAWSGRAFRFTRPLVGLAARSNDAAAFFREHGLRGPIFNDAEIGSYLVYHLFPGERVFADNRFGDAYSTPFWRDVYLPMIADEATWQVMQARYELNAIFFYQHSSAPGCRAFLWRRVRDPEWALVHADTFNVIFLRNRPENASVIEEFEITKQNAGERLAHLLRSDFPDDHVRTATLFTLVGRRDLAMDAYLEIVRRWPGEGRVWFTLGQMKLQGDRASEAPSAAECLERALASGKENAELHATLGLAYSRSAELEKARDSLERALALDPELVDASDLLREVEERLRARGD